MRFNTIALSGLFLATTGLAATTSTAETQDEYKDSITVMGDFFSHLIDEVTTDLIEIADDMNDEEVSSVDDIISLVDFLVSDPEESREQADIAHTYFDRLVSEHSEIEYLPVKNTTCITVHCSGAIASCVGDSTCRTNMECQAGCATMNTTCTFACAESYPSSKVDNLLSCLFVDHQCLSLPPPDPLNNATCRNPTEIVDTVEDEQLNGTWYVVQGFNPLYDCYACQELTFDVTDGQIDYTALFSMIAANGTMIMPTAHMTGEDRSHPGQLIMSGFENGLPDEQIWNVMYLDEDTFIVYYCGDILDAWHFEGLLVMSKTYALNPAKADVVKQILADLDIAEEETCKLDPQVGCDLPVVENVLLQW